MTFDTDDPTDSIARDAKLITALVGGGVLLFLLVVAHPKIAFFATVLLGLTALSLLLLSR